MMPYIFGLDNSRLMPQRLCVQAAEIRGDPDDRRDACGHVLGAETGWLLGVADGPVAGT